MSPLDPAEIAKNYQDKRDTVGIIVYRAIPLVEVDQLIQINVPADPTKPGSPTVPSGECNPVETRKVVSVPDDQHPYRLHYEHGLLEAYTFGATLSSDGILTAINTVSTPEQGKTLQNLASAAASAAGPLKAAGVEKAKPDCTVTPVFVGYEHLPTGAAIKEFPRAP